MTPKTAVNIIKTKFETEGKSHRIPLMRKGRSFSAVMTKSGIEVDNLATSKLLEWKVFESAIRLLQREGGQAKKGNAMNGKLGDEKLPEHSNEGYIAYNVFGKENDDRVFRRISPVASILSWAGICENGKGYLKLK